MALKLTTALENIAVTQVICNTHTQSEQMEIRNYVHIIEKTFIVNVLL